MGQLDGLRALAVLLVFLSHVSPKDFPGGFFGVDVFFVLSGYLITSLLLREHGSTGRLWLKGFYARRALRLVPAFAVVAAATVLASEVLGIDRPLLDALFGLTYLMDVFAMFSADYGGLLAHTWSLAVEEQFYLVWPVVLLIGLRRRWNLIKMVAIGAVSVAAIVAAASFLQLGFRTHQDWMFRLYRSPLTRVPELAAGVALALLLKKGTPRLIAAVRAEIVPAAVIGGLLIAAPTVHPDARWLYFGGFVGTGLIIALLVCHLLTATDSRIVAAFRSKPAVWLGLRSYGFYLWHYPVLTVLGRYVHSLPLLGVVGFAITLLLTEASWKWVEQPFLRRKIRFEPSLVSTAASTRGT
jgi:peptidoglycan/LPS O-acetylase OafA/YrhL